MKKIVLISCVKQKMSHSAMAKDLYTSNYFRLGYAFATYLRPDAIFILSAKYGLVEPETVIEPYDLTLNKMVAPEIKKWADRVIQSLKQKANLQTDQFIFLGGEKYRRYLIPLLAHYEVPMEGLPIGKQMHFILSRIQ